MLSHQDVSGKRVRGRQQVTPKKLPSKPPPIELSAIGESAAITKRRSPYAPPAVEGLESIGQERKRQKAPAVELLPGIRARDALPEMYPAERAKGKSTGKSLLSPQDLARRILPAEDYLKLKAYSEDGVKARCGPPWPENVVRRAIEAGPHVSALTPGGIELIWEDIQYQVQAGFVRIVTEEELFQDAPPGELKVSRVAIVPQLNRRDRIILNLSAEVAIQERGRRPHRGRTDHHPSVNETTEDAEDQVAVQKLGQSVPALLRFTFEVDCEWELWWQKIDLLDGFWRMVVEGGAEFNFVFQMPPRPGDTGRHYVIPSSLQMGWKNSPAYFCTATDLTRKLIARVLGLTLSEGLSVPHPYDEYIVPKEVQSAESPGTDVQRGADIVLELQVFVDDFMNGLGSPRGNPALGAVMLWFGRASMHAIHSVFPPPEVLNHRGGKDSISKKKVEKGDATFEREKEMLGKWIRGYHGAARTVGLPAAKMEKYVEAIRQALDSPAHRVSLQAYQKILGKIQYASEVMPAMKGYLTPLNQELKGKAPGSFIGLGKSSQTREVLEEIIPLIRRAWTHPSHITEIVPADLPHFYGTTDASGAGFGGVLLPCTRWLQPTVWRLPMPLDLEAAVTDGSLTMVDCEFVGYFIGNALLQEMVLDEQGSLAGMNSHFFSDNSPTVGIVNRQASKAKSPTPARTLRWLATRQRLYRCGPQTIQHWPGEQNTMADIPSRSFAGGRPKSGDREFLTSFISMFPLPTQLASWRLVNPRPEICSAAFSLLRKVKEDRIRSPDGNGSDGLTLPGVLAKTVTWQGCKGPTNTWNESTCSWPLLMPCGRACLTAESPFPARQWRERYATAGKSWQTEDLQTLANVITAK